MHLNCRLGAVARHAYCSLALWRNSELHRLEEHLLVCVCSSVQHIHLAILLPARLPFQEP